MFPLLPPLPRLPPPPPLPPPPLPPLPPPYFHSLSCFLSSLFCNMKINISKS